MLAQIEFDLRFFIEPQILPYCGPLFFARSRESATGNVTDNGTFGLVDTGEKKVLVTCHHVWDELQKARREDSTIRLLAGLDRNPPVVLDPSQLLDHDESLDIATYDVEPLLAACAGRKFYALNQNPAPSVEKGDQLVFAGYPGQFRSSTDEGVQLGRVMYKVSVSDVSGLRFVADISRIKVAYNRKPEPEVRETPHGGISGSPCFRLRGDRPLHLVGFATSVCLGILSFTDARCLNPDGTIDKRPS